MLGPNGAGKSSLLEAVYILATTRSFRTAQLQDCARHGSQEFCLFGEVEGDRRVGLEVGWGPRGRYRAINGSATSLVEHLQVLPVVAWTADDREILSGPPDRRRRFLDQGIVGIRPTALEVLAKFRRTLTQKRQLLLTDGQGLDSWNELLASSIANLMRLRREYLDTLTKALTEVVESTDLDLPDLEVEYRPSIQVGVEDEEAILQELETVKKRERRERRPVLGPQRDEVLLGWGEHSVRKVGSAGERKILGLLLTAARGRVLEQAGRVPVYLLDDADSELDEGRLSRVWPVFAAASQVFVSSSRPGIWTMVPEARRWRLESGRIGSG